MFAAIRVGASVGAAMQGSAILAKSNSTAIYLASLRPRPSFRSFGWNEETLLTSLQLPRSVCFAKLCLELVSWPRISLQITCAGQLFLGVRFPVKRCLENQKPKLSSSAQSSRFEIVAYT